MSEQVERALEDRDSRTSLSTKQLLQECVVEAKDLARIEVALARDEAFAELTALRATGISFLVAAALAAVALSALVTSVIVVAGYVVGLLAFGVFLAAAVATAYAGYRRIPAHPMEKTRRRLAHESHDIQQRLA